MCVPDPPQQQATTGAAAAAAAAAGGGAGTFSIPDPAAALAALRADPRALAALPLPLQEAVRAGDLETLGAAMR